jgi:hypothetical protein
MVAAVTAIVDRGPQHAATACGLASGRNSPEVSVFLPGWSNEMAEPLPILMEHAIQIAWDYLERTGELGDPEIASRFLMGTVELLVRRGERRRLLLSNKAIDAYQRFSSKHKHLALVS